LQRTFQESLLGSALRSFWELFGKGFSGKPSGKSFEKLLRALRKGLSRKAFWKELSEASECSLERAFQESLLERAFRSF